MKITFVPTVIDPSLIEPKPAGKKLPEWYKNNPRYFEGGKKPAKNLGATNASIKACMPILDVMTSGYLIFLSADVFIEKEKDGRVYTWADYNLITFHSQKQLTNYPKMDKKIGLDAVPKFQNHWIVQTPKGYSSLFITPFHHDLPFTILPAIVDTDTYFDAINFPFLPDGDFEGLIPKGTPIAQVIPIKRDNWEMSIEHLEHSETLRKRQISSIKTLSSQFFDKYKKSYWVGKNYK